MDLTKKILITNDYPSYSDKNKSTNEVFNMGVIKSFYWENDKDAIGVWKIKQLKQ